MDYKDIKEALAELNYRQYELETSYEENGGEITEETEAQEADIEALRYLLENDAVDELGRWLKAVEDKEAALKAEKAAIDGKIKAQARRRDFVKGEIARLLDILGKDKVKGTCYSFSRTTSCKKSVDTAALDDRYLELVTEAARNAGLPSCIDVALKTTTTRLLEYSEVTGDDSQRFDGYVIAETADTVRFTKPRAAKEA